MEKTKTTLAAAEYTNTAGQKMALNKNLEELNELFAEDYKTFVEQLRLNSVVSLNLPMATCSREFKHKCLDEAIAAVKAMDVSRFDKASLEILKQAIGTCRGLKACLEAIDRKIEAEEAQMAELRRELEEEIQQL